MHCLYRYDQLWKGCISLSHTQNAKQYPHVHFVHWRDVCLPNAKLTDQSIISASYFVLVPVGPKIKTERQAREIYSSQQYAESLVQLWNNNTNGNLYVLYLSKYFNSPRRVKIMWNNFLLMFYSICNSRCVNAWILKCGETGLYCATLPHKCDRAAACVSHYKMGRWPKYDFRSSYSWNLSVPSNHIIYENT